MGGFLQLLQGKCLARDVPGLLLACVLSFPSFISRGTKGIPGIPPGPNAAPTK